MLQVPDELQVERYGGPDPDPRRSARALAWRTTGYAVAVQVGLWVVVTLLAALVDGILEAQAAPGADDTFSDYTAILALVAGLAAVGVTVLAGFSLSWLVETALRRFAPASRRERLGPVVFAVAGAVVGGGLTLLALRGQLERPGDADPVTRGALVWGVVAGGLPAGAGRWLAARRGRGRRQTAV